MILFMELKDLHGQVMVKKMKLITSQAFQKMISDQIICVNLNAYVDVISDPIWGRYISAALHRYRKLSELEQIHLTYSAHFFKLWPVV